PGPPEPGCAAAAPPTTSTSSSSTAAAWPEKTPHGYAPRGQPHSTQGCSPPDCPPSPPKQCGSPTTGTCSPNSPWTRQTPKPPPPRKHSPPSSTSPTRSTPRSW